MQYGYKLAAEGFGPKELVRQAQLAEASGFDFVEISDHFHPWLDSQGHSPFAWSVLGAIAAGTDSLGLATGVTCPTVRYHPAVIAQAAATMSLLSDGRFTLGLGSGERLNEHVVGRGFPAVAERQAMLREAIEIIRLLWSGGYHSYRGEYLDLEDARVFDLPERLPQIVVAAGGPDAAELAAELGDGMFGTEPKAELFEAYRSAGGAGPAYGEVGLAWAEDEASAVRAAFESARWSLTGWKVMSELPNPANFEASARYVREEDVAGQMPCGPDAAKHLAAIRQYEQAGYDHVVLMNNGSDPDGFLDFFARELKPQLAG
ncbi:TIGR03557 family F420-dependent LLM class oxidoreductase [Agromyces tardus]|jgi:G6PDH family F420-dependent oxidoreductase|uniref:TIGR03557 family F420-dependent LLM class oxidoreductase n=1 Tax=Agromyces tardus TaxID=2583849 RepID=A0A3M8AF78_9MICO|nr:TIGR03557 family F420-dependent LLM class oxidoreductase [Agromyces tardus]RNB49819.1 TIGR03557 family F420-dependent LLM class oxidoreductase [Agromyces tardus]